MSVILKNYAIEYDPKTNSLNVCTNYLTSKQHLREEFARESTFSQLFLQQQSKSKHDNEAM